MRSSFLRIVLIMLAVVQTASLRRISRLPRRFSSTTSLGSHGASTIDINTSRSGLIPLSNAEYSLFEELSNFVEETKSDITLRVAGGWVRDKILGLQGKNDVDIAIDKMTGHQFITALNEWRKVNGLSRRPFNVVKKNTEKSKHLETG